MIPNQSLSFLYFSHVKFVEFIDSVNFDYCRFKYGLFLLIVIDLIIPNNYWQFNLKNFLC